MQYHVRGLHTYSEEPVNHLKTKKHCSLCKVFVLLESGNCFVFFRNHTTYAFNSHRRNSAGIQTAGGSSILLTFLSYEETSVYIHQYYLDNVDNTDRGEPYELQFVKVSPSHFASESLKYNVLRNLKRKYANNTIQSQIQFQIMLETVLRNSLLQHQVLLKLICSCQHQVV